MEATIQAQAKAEKNLGEFFRTHDISYIAEDATFTDMNTGKEINGRAAIAGMLNYLYHVAFDASVVVKTTVITSRHAVLELLSRESTLVNLQA